MWQTFRPNFRSTVPDLVVRPHVVYGWLYALKQLNPLYKDIVIVDDENTRAALLNITNELINNTTVMEHDALINIEKQVQSATASYGVNESISFSCPSVEAEILNLNND